jgi:hypothetical protein
MYGVAILNVDIYLGGHFPIAYRLITIGIQSVKSTMVNPVKSLKTQ